MSIRKKITLPAILLTVVSVIAVLVTVILVFSKFVDNSVYTEVDIFAEVLDTKLNDRRGESRLGAMAVAGDLQIRAAIENGDQEAVAIRAAQLLSENTMDFLTITDAAGIVLARAHEAGAFGDDISGQRSVQAPLRGEAVTLIDEGPIVKLSVQSGQAVYGSHGALIGTVTTGYRLDTDAFVDQMQDLIECEVSVFLNDSRIATTVQQEDGSRAIGLALDEAISAHVLGGNKFSGAIEVVGSKMYAVYLPLDSGQGDIVGMIFAGRYTSTKSDVILHFILRSVLVSAVFLAAGILVMILIGKHVTAPIQAMVHAAQSLARGEVEVTVEVHANDEMGALGEAFALMVESERRQSQELFQVADGDLTGTVTVRSDKDVVGKALHSMLEKNNEVFEQIVWAANQVDEAARQVTESAHKLAGTSVEQVSAIEQLNRTAANLFKNTKENASRSEAAANLAGTILNSAELGLQQMEKMTGAVQEINEATDSIETVMDAIDNIAFQTNILALNAAVEAARAGVHGKGFSVVADEVRNLAEKSAEAARHSAAIIQNTRNKAELGSCIAGDTAQSLGNIVEEITHSSALMLEISELTAQQAESIELITENTRQIHESAQFTSTMSEETSASCQEMSSQAALMKQLVGYFRLRRNPNQSISSLQGKIPV